MKIALIGPGLMPIPPTGWGAIEILIWKYSEQLKKYGHEVIIFNSKNLKKIAKDINDNNFDFVHVHYDEYIGFFAKNLKKPFCATSHYGYINQKRKWSYGYYSIFNDFLSAPGIIGLSLDICNLYRKNGYNGFCVPLRNGVEVLDFRFNKKGNGKVLCLGKIEPRKQQALIVQNMEGKIEIDFVGPICDPKFISGKTCVYRGIWSKDEVENNLTEYSVLLLLSDGEAAPMVVVEALAAGLSIIVSNSANANLDEKPFISVLPANISNWDNFAQFIKESISSNQIYREKIREYALEKFDNSVIIKEYLKIISEFNLLENEILIEKSKKRYVVGFIRYWLSRIWVFMGNNKILRTIKNKIWKQKK